MMQPATLKKWLIAIAVLYLIFPRDLIPDFIGLGPGLIDDLLVAGLLVHFYRKQLRKTPSGETQESGRREPGDRSKGEQAAAAPEKPFDPYEILGIEPSASGEKIREAYKARMSEYHPDKVNHLGEDLQKLAHQKTLEIQRAYQQLRK